MKTYNIWDIINSKGINTIGIHCTNATQVNIIRMLLIEDGRTWRSGDEYKYMPMGNIEEKVPIYDKMGSNGFWCFPGMNAYSHSRGIGCENVEFSQLTFEK